MEARKIGPFSVSTVGLGCNNFGRKLDAEESAAVVAAALDAGINFFDTADRYGYGDHPFSGHGRSEEFLGQALGSRRNEVVVATKFGNPMGGDDPTMRGGSRQWVHRACEASLRRLGTDYIDIYQMHRPDRDTPIAETLGALGELVEAGKVRIAGCTNFTVEQLTEADAVSREGGTIRFESVQNEFSLLRREAESDVLPLCDELDIAFVPYFPLASGLLTGKYRRGRQPPPGSRLAFWNKPRPHLNLDDDTLSRVEELIEVATSLNRSLLDLAFSWLLSHRRVSSVIAGATTPEQVRSNVQAAEWQMSADEVAMVSAA